MSNGKDMIIILIVGFIKKTLYKNESTLPWNSHFGDSITVKIDLSNYATKTDIENISHIDNSSFTLKTNLANLKTEVDKLDIDKLAPVTVDLSKLSDVVKNDAVQKTVYDKLVAKVDNINTINTSDISNLGTKTALTTIKNKIPSVI